MDLPGLVPTALLDLSYLKLEQELDKLAFNLLQIIIVNSSVSTGSPTRGSHHSQELKERDKRNMTGVCDVTWNTVAYNKRKNQTSYSQKVCSNQKPCNVK